MGGQAWAKRFRGGFLIVVSIEVPGVYPTLTCPDPVGATEQLSTNSEWEIEASGAAVTYPNERAVREEALDQAEKGWLDGPFPFNEEGTLLTGVGPQLETPAVRFGV